MKIALVALLAFVVLIISPTVALADDTGASLPTTVMDDSSVGTINWGATSDALTCNSIFAGVAVASAVNTHYLKLTNFGFSIPTGATIDGIIVNITRGSQTPTRLSKDNEIKIIKADGSIGSVNKAVATNWPPDPSVAIYGGISDLWGETWTSTDINNAAFGIAISAHLNGSAPFSFSDASVDCATITVYYTTSGGGGSDTCTYSGSGDWNILGSDHCYITGDTYITGALNLIGTGWMGLAGTIAAHGIHASPGFLLYGLNGTARLYTR